MPWISPTLLVTGRRSTRRADCVFDGAARRGCALVSRRSVAVRAGAFFVTPAGCRAGCFADLGLDAAPFCPRLPEAAVAGTLRDLLIFFLAAVPLFFGAARPAALRTVRFFAAMSDLVGYQETRDYT